MKRRSFVKSAFAATAAIGFPTIVPSTVFGDNAPSKRVAIGIIGCGNIGANYHWGHLRHMQDVRVVGVCDAYKSKREQLAGRCNEHYGAETTKSHADSRELIARPDIDAVVVGTHDNWHTPMSIAAANVGKDVFCQKPMALDYSMTGMLRDAITKNRRVFQFGTQYRSMARWRLMTEIVRNGYIGKLERIDVWSRNVLHDAARYHVRPYGSTQEIPVPDGFDYDAWQGPSPMSPYTADRCTNWGGYHCPETSLGFIAGCAIHPLGIAQWGNNSDHTSPIRYEGTGNIPDSGIFRTIETWDVICDYENGVKLRFMDSITAKPVIQQYYTGTWNEYDGVVFHGSDGWIGGVNNGFAASDNSLWTSRDRPTIDRSSI